MKIILYALVLLGIPNLVGMLFGALPLLLTEIVRRRRGSQTRQSAQLNAMLTGFLCGTGCAITDIALVRLFGGNAPVFGLPTISSIWALFLSIRRSKMEAWTSVVAIFGVWTIWWLWLCI